MNHITPLANLGKSLSDVAMGKEPADIVIKNGNLVNVNTLEIQEGIDVAIKGDRIALVGEATHCIDECTKIIDATDKFISPGFMDGHIHVESSFLTVSQYAASVVPKGTTAIFMDPHEIANVLGMKGVDLMINEAKDLPLHVFTTMPSCVPAAPGFETPGATFTPEMIGTAMDRDDIIGLGEMMNFPGVINGDSNVHEIISETHNRQKCVTGHFSIPVSNNLINAYIAPGIRSCHETITAEDAIAKMRLGKYVKIREGSAWHDLKEVIKAITQNKISSRFAILVSDDSHPDTLIHQGHMDYIIKMAIEEGVEPVEAISMVSLNVAECFFLSRDLGSVSPGKIADINILSNLSEVTVEKTIIAGKLVSDYGKLLNKITPIAYPDWSKNSVHLQAAITSEDFKISTTNNKPLVNIIEIEEASVMTKLNISPLPVVDGSITSDTANNICKVAVFERHNKTGNRGLGFVKGFGFTKGAVASTYAHDCHNLLIVGTSDEDMAFAGNQLAKIGGGMIAVCEGNVLAELPLTIAGLMSEKPASDVQLLIKRLEIAWEKLGCNLISPFMTMSLLSLPVIPDIRLTDKGLVDVKEFAFIDLVTN